MGRVLILNGSPRAPKSHSRRYAQLFARACPMETEYREIARGNHGELCRAMEQADRVLLVFPLYADGLPATLLRFLCFLEECPPRNRPAISVLINCGFWEPEQNDTAVDMLRLFAEENGYPFGSVLKVGSGEAILDTPFRLLVQARVKRLARAVAHGRQRVLQVTMPLPRGLFLKASTRYWEAYGRKNGLTRAQMETMDIEGLEGMPD